MTGVGSINEKHALQTYFTAAGPHREVKFDDGIKFVRLHDISVSPVGCTVVEGLGNQSSFMLQSLEGLVMYLCLDHPAEAIKAL